VAKLEGNIIIYGCNREPSMLSRYFKIMAYFNVKCHFVDILKIYKCAIIVRLKKCAHNVTNL
jgi:hypothetical protein